MRHKPRQTGRLAVARGGDADDRLWQRVGEAVGDDLQALAQHSLELGVGQAELHQGGGWLRRVEHDGPLLRRRTPHLTVAW
jgi:hypothetical protein